MLCLTGAIFKLRPEISSKCLCLALAYVLDVHEAIVFSFQYNVSQALLYCIPHI
jgi:hypothetical protein